MKSMYIFFFFLLFLHFIEVLRKVINFLNKPSHGSKSGKISRTFSLSIIYCSNTKGCWCLSVNDFLCTYLHYSMPVLDKYSDFSIWRQKAHFLPRNKQICWGLYGYVLSVYSDCFDPRQFSVVQQRALGLKTEAGSRTATLQ